MTKQFTIRVYGILIADNKLLLVNETIGTFSFTKFPGGGLEWGEGIHACLIREFKEETGLEVRVGSHIYTTDFFVQSHFNEDVQVISVYYHVIPLVSLDSIPNHPIETNVSGRKEVLHFRWAPISELNPEEITFPIDKFVFQQFIQSQHI